MQYLFEDGRGCKYDVLWENPNPTAPMGKTSFDIGPLDGNDAILVSYLFQGTILWFIVFLDAEKTSYGIFAAASNYWTYWRITNFTRSGQVSIDQGYGLVYGETRADPATLIPQKIIGVRGLKEPV